MYLWLVLTSTAYGLLMLLDPVIYTYITYRLEVDSVYLGVCSALWSVFYILSNMCLGVLADRGKVRTLIAISFMASALSWLCMTDLNTVTSAVSYVLHSVSIASLNLSLNVMIFENIDSDLWGKAVLFSRSLGHTVRGFAMILLALANYIDVALVQQATIILIAVSAIFVPSTTIISERSIYRLYGLIKSLGSYLKASTSILYMDKPAVAGNVFERIWYTRTRMGVGRVAIATMFVTSVGEYVLAFVPLAMKNVLDIRSLWIAYGITSIMVLVVMLLLKNVEDFSKRLLLVLIIFRSLVLILGMNMLRDIAMLTLYLLLSSSLYLAIDTHLYNLFISITGGYRSSLYYTLRELGTITGSVLGGFMLIMGVNAYSAVAIALTLTCVILVV